MTFNLKTLVGAVAGLGVAYMIVATIPGEQPMLAVILGFGLTWLGMSIMERWS